MTIFDNYLIIIRVTTSFFQNNITGILHVYCVCMLHNRMCFITENKDSPLLTISKYLLRHCSALNLAMITSMKKLKVNILRKNRGHKFFIMFHLQMFPHVSSVIDVRTLQQPPDDSSWMKQAVVETLWGKTTISALSIWYRGEYQYRVYWVSNHTNRVLDTKV
jgi:hypothetical protein